jgi:iron(III) transport system substrate-binding protein
LARFLSNRLSRRLLRTTVMLVVGAAVLAAVACGGDNSPRQLEATPGAQADLEATPSVEATATADLSGVSLTVYSGRREDLVAPIIEQFEAATGIDVKVKYGSNSGLIATIFEEGGNSPTDVFLGSDPGALGAISDRLVVLPDEILDLVDTAFRSREGKWVGISGRARVVVYNTDELQEAELPDSIFDFTDSQWKGRIGWAPTNGSFQGLVTAIRVSQGEDRARQWLEQIKANEPTEYPNNVAVVRAVADGEVDVGFVNHYYLHRFLAEEGESFPARNHYLKGGDPGAVVLVAGAGIVDTAGELEVAAAERLLEFLLSQEGQQYFANETFEYPLVPGITTQVSLQPLSDIEVPDIDLSQLKDLEGTLALLRETGVLP